jgi:hypothetical protein
MLRPPLKGSRVGVGGAREEAEGRGGTKETEEKEEMEGMTRTAQGVWMTPVVRSALLRAKQRK